MLPLPLSPLAGQVTLGRLAAKSEKVAQGVVREGLLAKVVKNVGSHNVSHKIAAAFIVRAVAKHSPDLAADAVTAGALPALRGCLQHIDPGVKEAACWALDYIAQHNGELAKAVADEGVVPLLALAVQEPEVTLKRIAVSCLGSVAKHSPALAQTVLASRCLPLFGTLLDNYVEGALAFVSFSFCAVALFCVAAGRGEWLMVTGHEVRLPLIGPSAHTPCLNTFDSAAPALVVWFLPRAPRRGGQPAQAADLRLPRTHRQALHQVLRGGGSGQPAVAGHRVRCVAWRVCLLRLLAHILCS